MTTRAAGPVVAALALAAGFLLPGVPAEIGLFVAAGILPGLAAAAWLLPAATPWTRTIVGLALGPLVAGGLAVGPFAAGVSPAALVAGLGALSGLALAAAPRRTPDFTPAPGLDAPASRRALLLALAVAALCAVPALAHEWGRVKGDGWIHAGIVLEILERGLPPQDPRWAGQVLNYVWFYNFFLALLSGARGHAPFDFMVLLNLLDVIVVLGLVHLLAWTVWRRHGAALAAVGLAVVGLNAGAWMLWPLRVLRGLTGEVAGRQAVLDTLDVPVLTSWKVFYELAAPFAAMTNFIDKFTIGTAINQAWVQMLLALWAALAFLAGGPGALLALVAAGALGMLLFHGIVGLSAVPVLGLALLVALAARRRLPAHPAADRLVPIGVALAVGALAALPYTRAISQGWDPGRTGMAHSYLVPSAVMAWTLLTACGIVGALALGPARRLVRQGSAPGTLLVLFAGLMAGFAMVVNLPEDNESKFTFELFFALAVLAAPALGPAYAGLRARVGRFGAAAVGLLLFAVPFTLTLAGLTIELEGRASAHANLSPAERRFHAWLRASTPADAVVVDARFRDFVMVGAGRQLYCGSASGPEKAGFPAAEVRERHAVMADLYGPREDLAGDAAKLARLGRPVYVVCRDADFARPGETRALDGRPDLFRRLRDEEGFVVYSLLPTEGPGGSR